MIHRPQRKPRLKDWTLKSPYTALKEAIQNGLNEAKTIAYIIKTSGTTERDVRILLAELGIYFPRQVTHPQDIDMARKVELQKMSTFVDLQK